MELLDDAFSSLFESGGSMEKMDCGLEPEFGVVD